MEKTLFEQVGGTYRHEGNIYFRTLPFPKVSLTSAFGASGGKTI